MSYTYRRGKAAKLSMEVRESLGIISEAESGWTKEVNLISWNGDEPRYDIRAWSPDRSRMGRGITLSVEEMRRLVHIIKE